MISFSPVLTPNQSKANYLAGQYSARDDWDKVLTRGWLNGFLRRHPILELKKSTILDTMRTKACTVSNLTAFYNYYTELEEKFKLHPALIFNIDETSINFSQRYPSKTVCRADGIAPISARPDRMQSSTLVLCIPVVGEALHSTLIWPQIRMPDEFREFCLKRIRVVCGSSSWQTRQTFEEMMANYYLPEMVHRRELLDMKDTPILLLLDGHSSRLSLPVIRLCRKLNVMMLILPSHTSSFTEPLDRGPNGVLKQVYAKETGMRINHPGNINLTHTTTIPPVFRSQTSQDYYTDSASAYRRLVKEALPIAVETALSSKCIAKGWSETGFLLPPEKRIPFLQSKLPAGDGPFKPKTLAPAISGKLLTDTSTMIKIWEWKKDGNRKKLTEKKLRKEDEQTLREETELIEGELIGLLGMRKAEGDGERRRGGGEEGVNKVGGEEREML